MFRLVSTELDIYSLVFFLSDILLHKVPGRHKFQLLCLRGLYLLSSSILQVEPQKTFYSVILFMHRFVYRLYRWLILFGTKVDLFGVGLDLTVGKHNI